LPSPSSKVIKYLSKKAIKLKFSTWRLLVEGQAALCCFLLLYASIVTEEVNCCNMACTICGIWCMCFCPREMTTRRALVRVALQNIILITCFPRLTPHPIQWVWSDRADAKRPHILSGTCCRACSRRAFAWLRCYDPHCLLSLSKTLCDSTQPHKQRTASSRMQINTVRSIS